jgi:hypothetical protein
MSLFFKFVYLTTLVATKVMNIGTANAYTQRRIFGEMGSKLN